MEFVKKKGNISIHIILIGFRRVTSILFLKLRITHEQMKVYVTLETFHEQNIQPNTRNIGIKP